MTNALNPVQMFYYRMVYLPAVYKKIGLSRKKRFKSSITHYCISHKYCGLSIGIPQKFMTISSNEKCPEISGHFKYSVFQAAEQIGYQPTIVSGSSYADIPGITQIVLFFASQSTLQSSASVISRSLK